MRWNSRQTARRGRTCVVKFSILTPLAVSSALLISFLVLGASTGGANAQESSSTPSGGGNTGLVPIGPTGAQTLGGGPSALQAQPLTTDSIADQLVDSDINRRERFFDGLIELAADDIQVRHSLEELAQQDTDVELAWTARLALKLIDANSGQGFAPHHFGLSPSTPLQAMGQDPFAWVESMLGGDVPQLLQIPQLPKGLGLTPAPSTGRAQSNFSSNKVEISEGPDGAVVRIEESGSGGVPNVREYKGDSLEAIYQANPELKQEVEGSGGLSISMGGSNSQGLVPWSGFFSSPGSTLRPLNRTNAPRTGHIPTQGAVRTDVLGVRVSPLDAASAKELGLDTNHGLLVADVLPHTIAAAMGIESGSILLTLEDRALNSSDDVAAVLASRVKAGALHATWLDANGKQRSATWSPNAF